MSSKKIQFIIDLLKEASIKRLSIQNNHNGKHKLGCIIFDHKLNKQCVLQLWVQPV
jgi:hypothetical protein